MTWRVARALDQLRWQWDLAHPNRSLASDGSIGDAAHASRESDHNPWVKDGDIGVVTARDFTHDPDHGADAGVLAEALRRTEDPRVKYVIWNRRIWSLARTGEGWRPYDGTNPHTKHVHVSVNPTKSLYDNMAVWITTLTTPPHQEVPDMTPEQFAEMMKVQNLILTELRGINARVGYVANDGMKDLDAVRDKIAGND